MEKNNENQRVRITKSLLKDSLLTLLQEKNINHISVREICDKAGINRSTFYKYYGSPYDLLKEIEYEFINNTSEILAAFDVSDTRSMFCNAIKALDANPLFSKAILNSNVSPEYPLDLRTQPLFEEVLSHIAPADRDTDKDEYFYSFLINGGFAMMKLWMNKEKRETPEELTDYFFNCVDNLMK